MSGFQYVGSELDLFANVHRWKRYWASQLQPFITGDVLEAGAGIGSNTPYLEKGHAGGRWVCLEPDAGLAAQIPGAPKKHEVVCGTLGTLDAEQRFDTIIYIDVLEHIEKDREELQLAGSRLKKGGRVIVLSPAHQSLFAPFDAAVGHFRRYNRQMLRDISPSSLRVERLIYLDSVGLLASLMNRLLLKQSMPTKAQLRLWDEWMVPCSTVLDPVLRYSLGKTVVGVWRKDEAASNGKK